MRFLAFLFILLFLFSCQNKKPKPVTMKDDVAYLASDSLQGRRTGTPYELMAADYIAQRFEDLGMTTKGTEGYFQEFSFLDKSDPHGDVEFVNKKEDSAITGTNVIGFLDNKAENTIIIGAHYDHLGMGGEGSLHREKDAAIHNGADDNASGIAVMIHLIQKLKEANTQNNYLFIAFSGEELGLLGSNYFVKNPTINLEQVNYMMNMDMVGRLNEEKTLAVHGVGTSPVFQQTTFANKGELTISEHESGIGPSDHTSFYLMHLPVLHFFTGQHEDYHKPGDDTEKLNYEGMNLISTYIFDIISDLDDNGKLEFKKTKNESEDVPRFKVTLGVVPDYLYNGEGMRIDGVSEDRPAQKAGMQKGDIVKQMDSFEIITMMSYMKALSEIEEGSTSKVTIERDGELIEMDVNW